MSYKTRHQEAIFVVYEGVDAVTRASLEATEESIRGQRAFDVKVHDDASSLREAMADRLFDDITKSLAEKQRCTLIVPVGPIGQYELLAARCLEESVSLKNVVFIIMDEYLDSDNSHIDADDPLSFRGHMKRNLLDLLPESLRPTVIVPDPTDLSVIPALIEQRGLDFTYAGVGITGHLAFNDPVPGRDDPEWFAGVGTRIVQLSPETRLINSVTAAMGNTLRVPLMAVTVGMKEILAARTVRVWMNRTWQCAAIRRMTLGPVTAAFPASLLQRHPSVTLDLTRDVLTLPEPGLR